ncbi:MAG: hypothetical protein AAGC74_01820 [Verrucomicrobiota bacterium]
MPTPQPNPSCDPGFRRKNLDHTVPFTTARDQSATFFITINTNPPGKNQLALPHIWPPLLETIIHRNTNNTWQTSIVLAMPDHLHALISFEGNNHMTKAISDWKRWTARNLKINWQHGFFDHRLRNSESAIQKHNYILQNPVRANLCKTPNDWPYQWTTLTGR